MITIKKILVPTDFSSLSVPAIGYASSLAKDHSAEVIVLHALPTAVMKERFSTGYVTEGLITPGELSMANPQPSGEDAFETKKRLLLNFLEQKIGPELLRTIKLRPLIRAGKVVEEIVAAAREEQCDLIVMTSHASRIRRLLRGSIIERIVRRAPCPVLTIQPSAEVRTDKDERVPVRLIDKWAA
jgi:nucleotide-binding universal stress UspA family protein